MKRYYFAIVAAVLLCACASTRNTSRSSTQERVEERAESERQTSTQEQTEEQRDVVTISKTTTETKSTTTIYDTSSPAADSLGIPPPSRRPQRKRKPQTRRQPSINPLFVRSSTSNYAKPPTNKPRRTNRKTQARKRSKRIRHRRTCVGSASLQSAQLSLWDVFSYSVLSVENKFISLYRCRFTASCVVRVLLRRPRIFAKVVKLLSNIFHLDSQFAEYRVYTLDKYKVS